MSLIYTPSFGYDKISTVDTISFKSAEVNSEWITVAIATEAGQLIDYVGNLQNVNVGDILFGSNRKFSIAPTIIDFINTVVFKPEEVSEVVATPSTQTPLTITLTGTATAVTSEQANA